MNTKSKLAIFPIRTLRTIIARPQFYSCFRKDHKPLVVVYRPLIGHNGKMAAVVSESDFNN
jgi:hypothetical protein